MCLIVGLPCGQFHGCSISPMCVTSFFISCQFNAVPIITCECNTVSDNCKSHNSNEHSHMLKNVCLFYL